MTTAITNPLADPVRIGDEWVLPNGRRFPVIRGGDGPDDEPGVTVTVPAPPPEDDGGRGGKLFTAEEVEDIRRDEKDKLYPQIKSAKEAADAAKARAEELAAQLEAFSTDVDAQKSAEAAAAAAEEAERKAREEAEMEARDLITKKEEEWNQRLTEVETDWSKKFTELQEYAAAQEATLEKERAFQALEAYKAQKIAEAGDSLMPHLLDLVNWGSTEESIDAAIRSVADKTSAIIDDMQLGQSRVAGPKAVPTTGASPTGPLENQMSQQTLTREQIAEMSMEQYAALRPQLLAQARPRG